ncbi:MAG: hypothetical protein KAV87_06475, partial [Desulfobacteraceae bacterium]|nr:hypothetical protein [Desulfobacteraceae bacterium]
MRFLTFALMLTLFSQVSSEGNTPTASDRRLEPKRLFSMLNLDTLGMQKVRAAVLLAESRS